MTLVKICGRWLSSRYEIPPSHTQFYVVINVNVRLFVSLRFPLRLFSRCAVAVTTEIEQTEVKLTRSEKSVPPSLTYTVYLRNVREPRELSLKKIHFLDNNRTCYTRSARNARAGCRRGWKVARKTSYCNYRPQHAALWGYEFNHRRSVNFDETRKLTSGSPLGRQDRHDAFTNVALSISLNSGDSK